MATSTETYNAPRILIHALDQAGDVLDRVRADKLEQPTPCSEWDVGQLADHLVAAPERFLTMMRGEQPDWSTPPPHITESWGGIYRIHADDLLHAWHELEGDPPVPLEMQVAEFAVHTWDLATALGYPLERLDPEVAETGLGFLRANLKPEMRSGAFSEERPAPPGSGPYAELAAFAGREV